MDENANLRRLLAEEQSQRRAGDEHLLAEQAGRKEERAWREEAERRLLEEQRQPEKNRSLTLLPFLEACHHLSLMLQVQTDDSKATTGVVTNPVGRLYPRQIIRWQGFQEKQQDIWKQLMDPGFMTQHSFVPRINQDRFKSHLKPISCELDVRLFERDTVETEVEQLLAAVANDQKLQESLGLRGDVFFQSHMNLGNNQRDLSTKGKAKGVIGAADQFCIHSKPDGTIAAKLAIEFKAPHKLPQNVVEEGLSSEIRPDTDNINMGSDDPALASRALAAAVVTQLFSNMIGIGVQYGYVCTGQTYIFLHIPDDPSIVYYHVSVPNKDVCDDDEFRLCKTAVAQVFAFVLQSLVVESPPQSWRDAAEELDVWSVESAGTLSPVSDSVDNGGKPCDLPYKGHRKRGFKRSPVRARSYCKKRGVNSEREEDRVDEADSSPQAASRLTRSQAASRLTRSSGTADVAESSTTQTQDGHGASAGRRVSKRQRK